MFERKLIYFQKYGVATSGFSVQIKFWSSPRLALNLGSWLSRSIFSFTLWRHLLLSKSGKSRSQIKDSSQSRFASNMYRNHRCSHPNPITCVLPIQLLFISLVVAKPLYDLCFTSSRTKDIFLLWKWADLFGLGCSWAGDDASTFVKKVITEEVWTKDRD